MTFNVKPDMRPLTANIYKFQSKYGTKMELYHGIWSDFGTAGHPVVCLPARKYIVGGLTAGAVKE